MLTVHFVRECSMLTVEPYQFLTVFILFHDTILPEKFPETGLFVMKNRVFIEFISTKPNMYLFLQSLR